MTLQISVLEILIIPPAGINAAAAAAAWERACPRIEQRHCCRCRGANGWGARVPPFVVPSACQAARDTEV